MDGDRALLACRDSVDGKLRAGDNVAACENVGNAGLVAGHGDVDGALCAGGKIHAVKVDLLADGGDNGGNGQSLKLAGAYGLAGFKLHDLDLERLGLALAGDLDGRSEEHELHALCDRLFDLVVCCRHRVSVAAVDYRGLCAEADCRARNVDGDIAAADNGNALADIGLLAEVDFTQEVDAGHNAGQLVAGAADLCALGRADCEVECLEALLTQLIKGDVLADLNAGLELYAQILENLDLGIDNVLFEAEGWDAHGEHAAERLFLFVNGHGVALDCEIVCAAQAGRACTDDGDLLLIGLADLIDHLGNEAVLGLKILLGDELFDIVDSNGRVDVAARACVLACLVADAAADCRERVFFLYKLKRLGVSSLSGELNIALNGNVRRALCLAGRRAGLHDVGAGCAVIDVVALLIPRHFLIRLICVGDMRIGGAQLLAELYGVGLAVFNALAAGDALVLINLGDEVRAYAVGRAEQLCDAQRIAGAAAAVTYGVYAVKAERLVDFVDKAVILGALEHLISLLLADQAVLAVLGEVDGIVVKVHAHILFKMAAALSDQAA